MTAAERARGWLAQFNRLDLRRPPGDVPPTAWANFLNDARNFIAAGWLDRAAELGWDVYQLFACDRIKPFARLDQCGLLWLIAGGHVVTMDTAEARVASLYGAEHSVPARDLDPEQVALPWEL